MNGVSSTTRVTQHQTLYETHSMAETEEFSHENSSGTESEETASDPGSEESLEDENVNKYLYGDSLGPRRKNGTKCVCQGI